MDPSTLAARVYVAWHHASQRIFAGIERFDDVYDMFGDDSNFMVDGDHSGGQFVFWNDDFTTRADSYSQAQIYQLSPMPSDRVDVLGFHSFAEAGGTVIGDAPSIAVAEISIVPFDRFDIESPERNLRSTLEPGRFIGFQFKLRDRDGSEGRATEYVLAAPEIVTADRVGDAELLHDLNAGNFVDGELVPCFVDDCSRSRMSAVGISSWGRIKASLRSEVSRVGL